MNPCFISGKVGNITNMLKYWVLGEFLQGEIFRNLTAKPTILKHFETKILDDLNNVRQKVKLLIFY